MLAISVADILDASIAILVLIVAIYVGIRWFRTMATDQRVMRERIARIEGRLEGHAEAAQWPIDVPLPPRQVAEETVRIARPKQKPKEEE